MSRADAPGDAPIVEPDLAVAGPLTGGADAASDPNAADAAVYAREEVCALCRIDAVVLVEYVRHGVVVAEDEEGVRFAAPALQRVLRAVRVQREFEIELDALALVVDLFETLERQRREIDVLRGRLLARRN